MTKIVRSVCQFVADLDQIPRAKEQLKKRKREVESLGYRVQTLRICCENSIELVQQHADESFFLSSGTLSSANIANDIELLKSSNVSANVDLSNEAIESVYVDAIRSLFEQPETMFRFCFNFDPAKASAFFPSASSDKEGFVIGLQSPNLANGCRTLAEWMAAQKQSWQEISDLWAHEANFLGIDSSIAPMGDGEGSFVRNIEKLSGKSFELNIMSDTFLRLSRFIKENNPIPTGLCGLMFPCLEDKGLVEMYEEGKFSLERNIFLSLHSGTGIDTYPIGVDESSDKIESVLKIVKGLSIKYQKPLSIRFVSDGKAKIGDETNFNNPYLYDCKIRPLF